MIWRPSFDYNATTLSLSLSMRPATPRNRTLGGSRVYTAGTATSFRRATRRRLVMRIRFLEEEWPDVEAMIHWLHANDMGPIDVRTDQDDEYTEFEAYLESPKPDDDWEPVRDAGFGEMHEIELVWRRTSDEPFDITYFATGDAP